MRDASSSTTAPAHEPHGGTAGTALYHVPPLHYHRLRLLAECAAGLEQDTDFTFTPTGDLEITPKPRAGTVQVPARGKGKYPRNVVRLHTAPGADGSFQELRLEHGTADALFWSDSAVHKFVIPYVASCACHDAPQTLGNLISAWNHYPTDKVTVHALAHVIQPPAGVPLAMENRLHVVYAERQNGQEGTSLALAPLTDFVNRYPPVQPPTGAGGAGASAEATEAGVALSRVAYRQGGESDRQQRPEYTVLRALAEHACALSKEPQYFLFKAGEHGFRQKTTAELPDLEPGDMVIPAYTPTVPAQRPRLQGVWCDHEDGATMNVAGGSDAMFWSDAAVEQFMFPYYASKGGLHLGLRELLEMAELWNPAVVRSQMGEEGPRRNAENPGPGTETPRADAVASGGGDEALQACREQLRECEQKLRECQEKFRAPAVSDASGGDAPGGPGADGAPWTPAIIDPGVSQTTVAEFDGEFNNNYAVIHLSTSQYWVENPEGQAWQATWPSSPSNAATTDNGGTTTYLSPRRGMALLSSRNGEARVTRADQLTGRRGRRRA